MSNSGTSIAALNRKTTNEPANDIMVFERSSSGQTYGITVQDLLAQASGGVTPSAYMEKTTANLENTTISATNDPTKMTFTTQLGESDGFIQSDNNTLEVTETDSFWADISCQAVILSSASAFIIYPSVNGAVNRNIAGRLTNVFGESASALQRVQLSLGDEISFYCENLSTTNVIGCYSASMIVNFVKWA